MTQQKLVGKMTPESSEYLSQSERPLTAADRIRCAMDDGCDPRFAWVPWPFCPPRKS
jgi:hypothetical protein